MTTPSNPAELPRLFGKYRGVVLENQDLAGLGRMLIDVPAVPSTALSWAMPCVPYAGPDQAFLALPPIGASVWVEFEEGDRSRPIWTGCFWSRGEAPNETPDTVLLRTPTLTMFTNGTGTLELRAGSDVLPAALTLRFDAEGLRVGVGSAQIRLGPSGIDLISPDGRVRIQEG